MKMITPIVLCLFGCACQSTSFQTAPLAADTGCDPALAGRWASVDDAGHPNDELHLAIDADCRLTVTDREGGRVREGAPTTLRVGHVATQRYAWVTAGWADLRFDASDDLHTDPADVYLFRYHVEADALAVDFVDHKAVAHRIIDGSIPGTVRSDERTLVNRITGPAMPELLAMPELFGAEPAKFRREAGTP
jgi:hypothetical protein